MERFQDFDFERVIRLLCRLTQLDFTVGLLFAASNSNRQHDSGGMFARPIWTAQLEGGRGQEHASQKQLLVLNPLSNVHFSHTRMSTSAKY